MPGERETIDSAALLHWGRLCLEGLAERRAEINSLNVFPIPDADTGTNLLATMRAAVQAAQAAGESAAADPPLREVAAAMARGATAGARGNSGIILSQVLRGLADAGEYGPLTAHTLADALSRSATLVRACLSVPVEGTVLTVLDCAAASARARCDGVRTGADRAAAAGLGMRSAEVADHDVWSRRGDLGADDRVELVTVADVAVAAADGAAEALGETPSQLGVLREAGVVDAGARGLLVLLDALVAVTLGESPARPEYARPVAEETGPECAPRSSVTAEPAFEVMYLIGDTDVRRIDRLRAALGELGDSVAVVGDGAQIWSAHVHCADAGAAVEAGLAAGTLSRIRIESFAENARAGATSRDRAGHGTPGPDEPVPAPVGPPELDRADGGRAARAYPAGCLPGDRVAARSADAPVDRAVLAVATGPGAAALFEQAGAVVLDRHPVTSASLLSAIRALPHREVLVLPNGALPAHELVAVGVAARDAYRDVLLLPSGSMVQGLAALAVHDRARIAVDDGFAMSEAAAATRWGSVRRAVHRALTMVGTCGPGDGLGLVGHDVVVIDRDVLGAGRILLDRMLGLGGELVTLLMGAEADPVLADELGDHIARGFPGVEIAVYTGGQQGDLVQIGVE